MFQFKIMQTLIILLSFLFNFHPLHLTITNVDYDAKTKNYSVVIKIFTDDLQTMVLKKTGAKIPTDASIWTSEDLKNVNKYVLGNFQITSISPMKMIYVSKKSNENSVTLTYSTKITSKNDVFIRNSLMMELYGDQKNLVIVKINDNEKGYELEKGKEQTKIVL